VLYSDYPICHPRLTISPIMFQLIGKELKYEMVRVLVLVCVDGSCIGFVGLAMSIILGIHSNFIVL
jgi:hypothetical protein